MICRVERAATHITQSTGRSSGRQVSSLYFLSLLLNCMKIKLTVAVIVLLIITSGLYVAFRPHKQDPHYYAAACVVINDMGDLTSIDDFKEKLRTVIINENASYAMDKVEFDPLSAQGAIQRYQQLSAENKIRLKQDIDTCLRILMPKN